MPTPITDAESLVMQALWRRGEATAAELVEALAAPQDWKPATVKTLLGRLLGKGVVAAREDGRRYLYRPLLDEDAWRLAQSRQLLDRLFGGRVAPLVAHFSEQGELGREDLAELRRLLDALDDGR